VPRHSGAGPTGRPGGHDRRREAALNKAVEFVGRIEAVDRVELRARVSGYLDAILFKEGETVKEDDKLFQIDPAPFEAAVEARGAPLQAQGAYANASLQRQRAEDLVKTSATSVATRDERGR
jgi:membrane fusion protein (multidrug efflux system)